jgi:hypothetical protein
MRMMRDGGHHVESVMQWFEDGIEEGENGILVYPKVPNAKNYSYRNIL